MASCLLRTGRGSQGSHGVADLRPLAKVAVAQTEARDPIVELPRGENLGKTMGLALGLRSCVFLCRYLGSILVDHLFDDDN